MNAWDRCRGHCVMVARMVGSDNRLVSGHRSGGHDCGGSKTRDSFGGKGAGARCQQSACHASSACRSSGAERARSTDGGPCAAGDMSPAR